ncbi:hypothetical protein ABPG72_013555 [Tetrahymena utriculariae]
MTKSKSQIVQHNISDFINSGPRFKDTQSISQNRLLFLILLSVAMGFINYINADRAVQIYNGIYPNSNNESQDVYEIDFNWIEIWCNLPNCFFTPLILGYLSDFVSIQYLLNFTSLVMLFSTIFIYLYYCTGYVQLYVLSRIFFCISNEGLQNATFNLVYEYSSMYKCESTYFSLHSILGYNIQRSLPYIFTLIYSQSPETKQTIQDNQPAYYSQYLVYNLISCVIMAFINKKNQIKERNEEQLDPAFLIARVAPQQKLSFFKALLYLMQQNGFFTLQCLIGGFALSFTTFYFQNNGLISAIAKQCGFELYMEINFSTKGFTQISSIIFLYFIGKRMNDYGKKFKFYLFWYCLIGLAILNIFLNLIYFSSNQIIGNIIIYIFLFFIGLQYYCSFMAMNSIIFWYNQWFQRGMGYGLFSCSFNTFQTVSYLITIYYADKYTVPLTIIQMIIIIFILLIFDSCQINKIKIEKESSSIERKEQDS